MTKFGYAVFSVLILLFAGALWYLFGDMSATITTTPVPAGNISDAKGAVAPAVAPLVVDEHRETPYPEEKLTVKVNFPKIVLPQNPTEEARANDVIATFVADVIASFRKDAADTEAGKPKDLPASDLTMSYSTLLLSPSVISFRFDISAYVVGAAHPNNYTRILNYDIARHVVLKPNDLFLGGADYFAFLSTQSRAKLLVACSDCDDSDKEVIAAGTEPTKENFSRIGLTPGGIVVIFDPYQVAPYARGTQTVLFTLAELGDILAPETKEAIAKGQASDTGTTKSENSSTATSTMEGA